MSRPAKPQQLFQRLLRFAFALSLLLASGYGVFGPASAAQLGQRSLTISSATASVKTLYLLSFGLVSSGNLGSISISFCSNDPFVDDPCSAPTGFDIAGATLGAQTGQSGFSVASGATANHILLSRTPLAASPGQVSYQFSNVTNPDTAGSYFVRLQTYASNDGSGTAIDYGGIAFAINSELSVSAEVPPYLIFCTGITIPGLNCANASGNYIDFGEFSPHHASQGSSQMLTATNANSGYNITMTGTTLTSGNNVLPALATNDVSRPGTAQFGLNLRANTSPTGGTNPTGSGTGQPAANYDQPNFYRFVPDEIVASTTQPDDLREYTSSYIANIPADQAPGIYVSTITYVCLATF